MAKMYEINLKTGDENVRDMSQDEVKRAADLSDAYEKSMTVIAAQAKGKGTMRNSVVAKLVGLGLTEAEARLVVQG